MSKGQMLRALVVKRLTEAAEETCVLFERMIAEYEEEMCRLKEENQRKQELLDSFMGPRVVLFRAGLQTTSVIPGPELNQETTAQIEGEPTELCFKLEPEQTPLSAPEASAVCVKREEPPQTEHPEEEAQGDHSLEPQSHLETHSSDTDNGEDWRGPLSCSRARMESAWAGEDTQAQIRDGDIAALNTSVPCGLFPRHRSAPGTRATVRNKDKPETNRGDEQKKHQCFVCHKKFRSKQHLQTHIRIHTGERPYICSVCNKRFGDSSALRIHSRTHTGERPFSCSFCKKTFAQSSNLHSHVRLHTGNKPFSCSTCNTTFARRSQLTAHNMKYHTGGPSSFSI